MPLEYCLHENVIKHEATIDLAKLREFRATHDAHLAKKSLDPIFGRAYSFSYRPSSCGTTVRIFCECGEKADITDYSNW